MCLHHGPGIWDTAQGFGLGNARRGVLAVFRWMDLSIYLRTAYSWPLEFLMAIKRHGSLSFCQPPTSRFPLSRLSHWSMSLRPSDMIVDKTLHLRPSSSSAKRQLEFTVDPPNPTQLASSKKRVWRYLMAPAVMLCKVMFNS